MNDEQQRYNEEGNSTTLPHSAYRKTLIRVAVVLRRVAAGKRTSGRCSAQIAQSTRLVTEGTLEPFFFLYADDSIQGNPETCKQSSIMLNYEVKNSIASRFECSRY